MRLMMRSVVLTRLLVVCVPWAGIACADDPLTAPADKDSAGVYARLTLEHKAIVLSTHAPYDTVQLRAVARNPLGEVLPDTGRIEYQPVNPSDTSVVVDSNGFVTVRTSTQGTRVEARRTINGIVRTDTALIMVQSASPVRTIARMEFSPPASDSNWRWAGTTTAIGYNRTDVAGAWLRLFDANGSRIPANQFTIAYSWDNDLVHGGFDASSLRIAGETYIRAHVYAYGVAFSDSILFRRIEPPVTFMVIGREFPVNGPPRHRFYPDSVEVKPGATIIFMNANGNRGFLSAFEANTNCKNGAYFCGNRLIHTQAFTGTSLEWVDSTDVVFDDPTAVSAGKLFERIDFPGFPTTQWPPDGGSGNINAFGLMRCVRVTSPHNGCGARMSTTANTTVLDPGFRSRTFNTSGVYRFHSTRFPGAEGVVVVRD